MPSLKGVSPGTSRRPGSCMAETRPALTPADQKPTPCALTLVSIIRASSEVKRQVPWRPIGPVSEVYGESRNSGIHSAATEKSSGVDSTGSSSRARRTRSAAPVPAGPPPSWGRCLWNIGVNGATESALAAVPLCKTPSYL
jgi:hypothetical protein